MARRLSAAVVVAAALSLAAACAPGAPGDRDASSARAATRPVIRLVWPGDDGAAIAMRPAGTTPASTQAATIPTASTSAGGTQPVSAVPVGRAPTNADAASNGGRLAAFIEVSGVRPADLQLLRAWEPARAAWTSVLRVRVLPGVDADAAAPVRQEGGATDARTATAPAATGKPVDPGAADDRPPVAGRYVVTNGAIRFTPLFPFEAGRRFEVTFDPSRIAGAGAADATSTASAASAAGAGAAGAAAMPALDAAATPAGVVTAIVATPAARLAPSSAIVERVTPSGDQLPENLLRMYVHFSAPMGRRGGIEYLHLLDERGRDIRDPFLPVAAEFWNDDRTRYTVFLDPGRVKRGVRPNEQLGRSLDAGRAYTLVVDPAWRDTHGRPLAQSFRHTFRAGAAIERPLDPLQWRVTAPAPGTREPLAVVFPHALDHGLLQRALGVETGAGDAIAGEIRIDTQERRWLYVPRDPWRAGDYQLVVLTILEDPSGNRIGRAFETPESPRAGSPLTAAAARDDQPARVTRGFRIADRS